MLPFSVFLQKGKIIRVGELPVKLLFCWCILNFLLSFSPTVVTFIFSYPTWSPHACAFGLFQTFRLLYEPPHTLNVHIPFVTHRVCRFCSIPFIDFSLRHITVIILWLLVIALLSGLLALYAFIVSIIAL